MNILIFAIPVSLILGLGFVSAFIWSVDNDQFDDLNEKAKLPLEGQREETI